MKSAKTQHSVALTAIVANGDSVTAQNWQERTMLVSANDYFEVSYEEDDRLWILVTPKGTYELHKHATQNYYHTIAKSFKVHVIIKKMVGTLIYWA